MPLTKIEVAQRQLDCAIRLFLADDDSLAVHTLARAAFKVLFDVYPSRRSDGFSQQVENLVEKTGWRRFNRVPNFLKHADKDVDETLFEHSADVPSPLIGMAATLHHRITGMMTPEMRGFDAWMHIMHPDELGLPADPDPDFEKAFRESVRVISGRPWAERLSLGQTLVKFYREHPDVGGFGARRDPASY
jgi:hypothetical protein